mmetsp:Transcript_145827/g.206610  ORF Transcript_145827/g.206610 Transcript_145827/m.206610 type:complete len:289 (+) Transcript_145827:765-1631(+)
MREMKAMEMAQGRASWTSSMEGIWGSWNGGSAARPPAKAAGSLAFMASVGTSKLKARPTAVATARPTREDGIGAEGRNWVKAAQMAARVKPMGVERAPNCDTSKAKPKAFRKPASTSLETRSRVRAKPTKPATNSMRAASSTTSGTSPRPLTAVKAPKGTTTTAAEPATTPGRMPKRLAKPKATEDQRPTKGPVPTMALQAIALDSSEKATLMPARISSVMELSPVTGSAAASAPPAARSMARGSGALLSLPGPLGTGPPGPARKALLLWNHNAVPRSARSNARRKLL